MMIDKYLKYKSIYNEYVIFIKCGKFYYTYGNDTYIINYLFDYQIINNRVAFPEIILKKVENTLEKEKIAYLVIDKSTIYSSEKRKDYVEKYNRIMIKSKEIYNYKKRINNVFDKLLLCIKTREIDEKLLLIEEIL